MESPENRCGTHCFLTFLIGALVLAPALALPYDGDLDPTFGSGGILGIPMGTGDAWGRGLAAQPDGNFVIAGAAESVNRDFALTRVTPIGSLDDFGTGGKVYWDSGWGDDGGWATALQPDGKIVAVGSAIIDGPKHLTVLRFEEDGSPDTAFGFNGYAVIDFGVNSYGRNLVIQPDGKIIAVGHTADGKPAIVRLEADGDLDPTFGSGGIYEESGLVLKADREIWDVALWHSGAIAVVGSNFVEAFPPLIPEDQTRAYILFIDSAGLPIISKTYDFGGDCEARGVVFQEDGRNVMTGFTHAGAIVVARLDSGLNLDTSFNGDGIYTKDFGGGDGQGWDLMLQSDGRILVAGSATVDGSLQAVVFRLSRNGGLDKFGPLINDTPQGYTAFKFGTESRALSLDFAFPAKVVVAGDAVASNGRSVFLAAQLELPSLEIFADGFESGDASLWSAQTP